MTSKRVLAVTNMYPTPRMQDAGTFVEKRVRGLRGLGWEMQVLLIDRVGKGMAAYFDAGKQIRAEVEACRPVLVHVMWGGILAKQTARQARGKPLVVSFCGSDLLGGAFLGSVRRQLARLNVRASHYAARRADGIIVNAPNLRDALPKDIDAGKVRVIPDPVDLDRFKPLDREACRQTLGWSADAFHVLFPARPDRKVKRIYLARAAVEKLRQEGKNVVLHALPGLPNEEVPVWMNASDAVVLTSLHEGSPNVIKEALACNRPIVSVDVGDVRERLEGVEGCFLARPDPDDLAVKLRLVEAGAGVVRGRSTVLELSTEQIAERISAVYRAVLGAKDP